MSGPDTDLADILGLPGHYRDGGDLLPALLAQMENFHLLLDPLVYRRILRVVGDDEGSCKLLLFLIPDKLLD